MLSFIMVTSVSVFDMRYDFDIDFESIFVIKVVEFIRKGDS